MRPPLRACLGWLVAGALLLAPRARAVPNEYLTVGDALEDELRVLDVLGPGAAARRIPLQHLFTRPVQKAELQGVAPPVDSLDPARAITLARIERALGRDADSTFAPDPRHPSTPRAFQHVAPGEQRFDGSFAAEGAALTGPGGHSLATGSGAHVRLGAAIEHWLAYSHVTIGQIAHARDFADPIVPNNDLIVYTDETYLSYTADRALWSAQFGRNRWHWGPGEEGSLVLSKTMPAITGLAFRMHIAGLHLDAIALSATLRQARGDQLAAHRIEWQPHDALRIGLTEAARYRASGWEPLYVVGAIPYVLVQRLQVQDEPDSLGRLRNNIMVSFDAAWRVAPGTRIYGEWLADDLHAKTGRIPNKYGYQLGWEGAGAIAATRVTWGGEYTRLTRYVYTSFFGADFSAQGQPLGFPTGPDARRVRLRLTWDPNADWQLLARVSRTDQGENTIAEPFVPGSPRVDASTFEGIVMHSRDAAAGLRWWPASGVDVTVTGGWQWVENLDHVAGRDRSGATGELQVRLVR
ncbi:MAG TPA: capsule assembly Wzi family protein [Candidatus Eisenbacteria bacterium]|nr:capsule assembly Wzi family protein [Candidatus Eisenbacteria bacterium]